MHKKLTRICILCRICKAEPGNINSLEKFIMTFDLEIRFSCSTFIMSVTKCDYD